MAEIKSTLDMVLARAEAMCADVDEPQDDTFLHEGMKSAAAFMNGDSIDLSTLIAAHSTHAEAFCSGLVQVFLRHLTLPRDESQPWEKALKGLSDLAPVWKPASREQLSGYINEVRSILGRYFEHRKQVRAELEQAFAQQTAHLEQSLAQKTGMHRKLSPEQHPKFQEEWQRVIDQMNGQYLRAIDQYKNAITQLLTPSSDR